MSEDPSSSSSSGSEQRSRSWLERMFPSFTSEPKSRDELLDIIKGAAENKVVDQEALNIIEGALDVANLQVREIMIPRSQMVVIKSNETPEEFLPKVIESGHSRFPVIGESSDDVQGILLAKDMLPLILQGQEGFDFKSVLRPANIIPESKRLNVLLKDFREKRYHMALVIDEYGGISGLVTIEDILEEIVGDIEDETDEDNEEFIRQVSDCDYILKALTPIEDFNLYFKTGFSDEEFDTIGGLITQAFGHMPSRNETVTLGEFTFRVLFSDGRQIHLVRATRHTD
ncbi:HlyC/CorC family transporter [Teredinibacter turnerae]|uniref:Magnesium and cobalt efflux protein CorC n=1 Tax=Teredinibacter turnerae (strain ATCC 39867 / T7901) TaxID=377629 RepID=C5BT26_TERTT|nr:transporter associated domain-containing protein [Teredinibacter turnerae]ACR12628.1 magnesium and cobalt efflux protein CorC [Teredinibacter turnerae T7901]